MCPTFKESKVLKNINKFYLVQKFKKWANIKFLNFVHSKKISMSPLFLRKKIIGNLARERTHNFPNFRVSTAKILMQLFLIEFFSHRFLLTNMENLLKNLKLPYMHLVFSRA